VVVDAGPKVSILFVIDDSGSMIEEQTYFATKAADLAALLDTVTLDWRAGFVTCGMDNAGPSGLLIDVGGGRKVVHHDDAARETLLAAGLAPGTGGTPEQACLSATTRAVAGAGHENFKSLMHAPDRSLLVVVISDGDEATEVDGAAVKAMVTGAGFLDVNSAYVITGGRDGCSGPRGEAMNAPRYASLAEVYEVTLQSLCDNEPFLAMATRIEAELNRSVFVFPATAPASGQPSEVRVVDAEGESDPVIRTDDAFYKGDERTLYLDPPAPPLHSLVCAYF